MAADPLPGGSNGQADPTQPGKVAAIGIGVYVAGATSLATAFGGVQTWKSPLAVAAPEEPPAEVMVRPVLVNAPRTGLRTLDDVVEASGESR